MRAKRRRFSHEEKKQILEEALHFGITNTLNKHNLSYSVFSRWKRQFSKDKLDIDSYPIEIKNMIEENTRLRKIIADQALIIELRNEELKRLIVLSEKK
jgi:putative transposase